jgi:dethiobiotin synthetase
VTICFVTGTDTGIGKTVVTAALAAVFLARGDSVAVVKPTQTGVDPGEPGDAEEIRRLAGVVDVLEGVRLPAPLAPDRAAVLAGVDLPSLDEQRDLITGASSTHDQVLVEGSGGIAVRLGEAFTLLDIAEQVRAGGADVEWYVVCGPHLGTLNHSTLTVQAIQHRGDHVRGLVIGAWPTEPGPAEQHNVVDLPRYAGVPVLGAIPSGASSLEPRDFRTQALTWLPHVRAT